MLRFGGFMFLRGWVEAASRTLTHLLLIVLFSILALVLVVTQFVLPRRLAFVPLVVAVCHFQNVPVLELGASFSVCKLVILAGLIRAANEGRFTWTSRVRLDVLVAAWAGWMFVSGFAHNPRNMNPITIRLSMIYDFAGAYLYVRAFLRNYEDFIRFLKILAVMLLPLALLVLVEKTMFRNIYYLLARIDLDVAVREGRVRASGSFGHPILMGTFGATSSLLLVALYRLDARHFKAGIIACGLIVFCSASSSPIISLFSGMLVIGLWRYRTSVGWIRRLVLCGVVVLHLIMQAPVWYLIARIDLAGGSTGWHRAELITAAVNHFGEWWLTGTDYTRHWMPYGVEWSGDHIDITNFFIRMGVTGGLLLLVLFVAIILAAFNMLGARMKILRKTRDTSEFTLWCVGATLFAHCFSFISVSYFDQSFVLFGFILGVVPALCLSAKNASANATLSPVNN